MTKELLMSFETTPVEEDSATTAPATAADASTNLNFHAYGQFKDGSVGHLSTRTKMELTNQIADKEFTVHGIFRGSVLPYKKVEVIKF